VADVQPPDLETRIAILQTKSIRDRLHVPDEVLHYNRVEVRREHPPARGRCSGWPPSPP
jgi:chromosomal replication initiation ATPase DnaA